MNSKNKRLFIVITITVLITSFIWVPALVFAVTDNLDKYDYYISALNNNLQGLIQALAANTSDLIEFFKANLELFSEAVYGG